MCGKNDSNVMIAAKTRRILGRLAMNYKGLYQGLPPWLVWDAPLVLRHAVAAAWKLPRRSRGRHPMNIKDAVSCHLTRRFPS